MKIKCVLHKRYGGFHLTTEIADEMDKLRFDWNLIGSPVKLTSRCEDGEIWEGVGLDRFVFRSDPAFVKAVENIQYKYKDLDFVEKQNLYIFNLKIVEFSPFFEIIDYKAGHEQLICNGNVVYE